MSLSKTIKSVKTMDMTQGNTVKLILTFALPLLVGNLFQQLYNTVDTYVVGNYVSGEAYAAVGNTAPVINTLIGFFSGLSTGAGVVISQCFGAKDYKYVKRSVHTAFVMTLFLGVVFTAVGILMTPGMLGLMNTPDEVFPEGKEYLTIYFSGIIGLMIYNIGAGILRAVGDSRRPFIFLVISALLNVLLDLTFVIVFRMGVAGVAYATIISQGVSALLVLFVLFRSNECYKLSLKDMKCSMDVLKRIIVIGFPAAIQMAITAFSNVFVQSYINHFGKEFMGGWTSYSKIDQFLLLPMQSIALASTTFVGQNIGAGNIKRAKKGANIALTIAVVSTAVLMIPVLIFAPSIVRFFEKTPATVAYGAFLLRIISPFYILCCVNQIYAGALRGVGKSVVPMVIMLLSFVAFRQAYLYISSLIADSYVLVALAYPAGWIVCSTTIFIYYRFSGWENKLSSLKKE